MKTDKKVLYFVFNLFLTSQCFAAADLSIPEQISKAEAAERAKTQAFFRFAYSDEEAQAYYDETLSRNRKREETLKHPGAKRFLSQEPIAQIAGGLTYLMSLDEMRDAVVNIFKKLYKEGKILTKEQFALVKPAYYTGPLSGSSNLTRIWGADYLKKSIVTHPDLAEAFDVPDYVLVVDDPEQVTVTLWFGENWR